MWFFILSEKHVIGSSKIGKELTSALMGVEWDPPIKGVECSPIINKIRGGIEGPPRERCFLAYSISYNCQFTKGIWNITTLYIIL